MTAPKTLPKSQAALKSHWNRDERYIRIAGALLMVSPLMNFLMGVALNSIDSDKWTLHKLTASFMMVTGLTWIGRICNLLAGFLMLRGKSSAWIAVLAILGFTIAKNIITFKQDFQTNHLQTIVSFMINLGLFLLVLESEHRANKELDRKVQEARLRQQAARVAGAAPAPAPTPVQTVKPTAAKPATVTATVSKPLPAKQTAKTQTAAPQKRPAKHVEFVVKRGMPIVFDGHGKIGEVLNCTPNELWLKPTNHLPQDIHKRTVTLQDPENHQIRLKFAGLRDDSTLIFRLIS